MSYNSKKAAQAAARKSLGANYAELCIVAQVGNKWEFAKNEITLPEVVAASEEYADTPDGTDTMETAVANYVEPQVVALEGEFIAAGEQIEEISDAPAAPSMLSGLLGNMTGDIPVVQPVAPAKAEPKVPGLTVEKDRPMQNGVKRPSAGGLCRAVWDACWEFQEQFGTAPTAKEVKEIASEKGWNSNNASIEYYQWRKYNGISGRVTKAPAKNVETVKPANFGAGVAMPFSPVAYS